MSDWRDQDVQLAARAAAISNRKREILDRVDRILGATSSSEEPLTLTLSSAEKRELLYALEDARQYPSLYAQHLALKAEAERVEEVRGAFELSSGKTRDEAAKAVTKLGWTRSGTSRRNARIASQYAELVQDPATSEATILFDMADIAAGKSRDEASWRIEGLPLGKNEAVSYLARFYDMGESTIITILQEERRRAQAFLHDPSTSPNMDLAQIELPSK